VTVSGDADDAATAAQVGAAVGTAAPAAAAAEAQAVVERPQSDGSQA